MNNKESVVSQLLSIYMGTCGVMYELLKKVKMDSKIDELDDSRREEYINFANASIEKLNYFKKIFRNKEFDVFVNQFSKFLRADINKQNHYESLSDEIRMILHETLTSHKERLQQENEDLELRIFTKDINNIKIKF